MGSQIKQGFPRGSFLAGLLAKKQEGKRACFLLKGLLEFSERLCSDSGSLRLSENSSAYTMKRI